MLYPLKFRPILKSMLWGGSKLTAAGKKLPRGMDPEASVGESWEISGVGKNVSVVSNGFLKSNDLEEIVEIYMGELVGDSVYEKYGLEFPVLIKLIDAREVLSIQVHPGDELALERHGTRGKTEMWYVIDHEPGAFIYAGFKRTVSREEYLAAAAAGKLAGLLEKYEVKKGDVYYIPAGTVHAIGKGILLAEIQETSEITYRIDDWGRTGADGKPRELHTAEAAGAVDLSYREDIKRTVIPQAGTGRELVASPYFTTNILWVDGKLTRDYAPFDSFVAYVCTEGEAEIAWEGGAEKISALQSVLIPAEIDEITLSGKATILEVHM